MVRWDSCRVLAGVVVIVMVTTGCGDERKPSNEGNAGGSSAAGQPAAGSAGASDASGSGGAAAGTGGTPSAGAGAGGSGDAGACTGTFGQPSLVLSLPGMEVGGLTLGPGELELLYGAGPVGMTSPRGFFRSVRTNRDQPFSPGEPVPELDAACGDATLLRSGDLSADGLRFYFTCYATFESGPAPLRVARRSSSSAPFVVDAESQGTVGAGPSISADELTLFTSPSARQGAPLVHSRGTSNEPFGPGTELSALLDLFTPEISPDGRFLFAATTTAPQLVVSERMGDTFSAPQVIHQKDPSTGTLGSPAISSDCRSLYYVDVANMPEAGGIVYTAMVLTR